MMLLPLSAVALGFVGLLWSADRFVGAAAATAYRAGMSTLLIGFLSHFWRVLTAIYQLIP